MKAVALDHGGVVRNGVLRHMLELFSHQPDTEVRGRKKSQGKLEYFEDIRFFESAEEFDDYVKHLYD